MNECTVIVIQQIKLLNLFILKCNNRKKTPAVNIVSINRFMFIIVWLQAKMQRYL